MTNHPTLSRELNPDAARSLQAELSWTGVSGVVSIVMLAAFLALASHLGADPLSASAADLSRSLGHRDGAHMAGVVLTVSALSYLPLIAFFAGLRSLLSRFDVTGIAASVVGIAAPLFLAGAIASDGFNLALVVAEHSVSALHPSAQSAQLLAAGWRVSLVEAQVALSAVCAAGGVAALRAAGHDAMIGIPRWAGTWGIVGAVAVLPLVVAPGTTPVFVASNLVRFSWVLAMSIALLSRSRRLATTS